MQDMLAALLLVDHFAGRTRPDNRKTEPVHEPELPWSRVFAWHRRRQGQ